MGGSVRGSMGRWVSGAFPGMPPPPTPSPVRDFLGSSCKIMTAETEVRKGSRFLRTPSLSGTGAVAFVVSQPTNHTR